VASLIDRMIRAARLEPALYEEVEADPSAMGQAVLVVLLSSVAAAIGGPGGFVADLLGAFVGWFLWSFVVFVIGTRLLPEPQTQADYGQLLRTIGFSASPGVLRVVGFIPLLGWIVGLAASIWMLVAMVVAVRQALDYRGTGRAVLVCLIGFVVYLLIEILLGGLVKLGR
jgi:hypothetical protein